MRNIYFCIPFEELRKHRKLTIKTRIMKQTRHLLIALALGTMLTSCGASGSTATVTGPAAYVDPYIGSGGHGHVFVGASVPFGAITTRTASSSASPTPT